MPAYYHQSYSQHVGICHDDYDDNDDDQDLKGHDDNENDDEFEEHTGCSSTS